MEMFIDGAWVEPSLMAAEPGARMQFERTGFFCVDSKDSAPGALVFVAAMVFGMGLFHVVDAAMQDLELDKAPASHPAPAVSTPPPGTGIPRPLAMRVESSTMRWEV